MMDLPPIDYCEIRPVSANSVLFLANNGVPTKYLTEADEWVPVPISILGEPGRFHLNNFVFKLGETIFWGTGKDLFTPILYREVFTVTDGETKKQLDDFPGLARHKTTYFILGNRGYVGLGQDLEGHLFKDFWALDFISTAWSKKADLPDTFRPSLSFTTNNKAYLLTGYDVEDSPLPNFYEYDPDLDQWTPLADFGNGDGTSDIGFGIDGVIYGGLGISKNGEVRREIWRYIPELK
jgi:hypothetical protein